MVLLQAKSRKLHPEAFRLLEDQVAKHKVLINSLSEKKRAVNTVAVLEETKSDTPQKEFKIDIENSDQVTVKNAGKIINDYTAMLPSCKSDFEKAHVLQIRSEAYKKIGQYQNALRDSSAVISLVRNIKGRAMEHCSRASIYRRMFDFAKAIDDIKIALSLIPPNEYMLRAIDKIFNYNTVKICEYILRDDCPDTLREIIQEKLSKAVLDNLDKEPSTHTEICKLYLSLVMKRQNLFKNELSFLRIKMSEAKKLNLSQEAILNISSPGFQDRKAAEITSPILSDSDDVKKTKSKTVYLFSFYKRLPENNSAFFEGDSSLPPQMKK
jgi:tetratricopeptide (TPR) repeat protein